MKHFICAVRDEALGQYIQPFTVQAIALAERAFTDECKASDSPPGKHPEDYSLWLLATYDPESGGIEPQAPLLIMRGVDIVPVTKA